MMILDVSQLYLYFTSLYDSKVRRMSVSGGSSSDFAGTGSACGTIATGDGGPATSACIPNAYGIATNTAGVIYVTSAYAISQLRAISTGGIITTVGGTASATSAPYGDGGAFTSAYFNYVTSISVDSVGNLYVSDYSHYKVRKVNTNNIVSTFVGTGEGNNAYNSNYALTSTNIKSPGLLLFGTDGYTPTYLSSRGGSVYRISSNIAERFAGNDVWSTSSSGDGVAATSATLKETVGMHLTTTGRLYIGDANGLRMISPA